MYVDVKERSYTREDGVKVTFLEAGKYKVKREIEGLGYLFITKSDRFREVYSIERY
jgi:hypothetical protein